MDIAEASPKKASGACSLAIDRTSKFVYAELHRSASKMEAAQFLRNLIAAIPYKIHTILTANGIQFCNHERHRYAFEHRLTKIPSLANGQVERMNRTLKEAAVKKFYYSIYR